MKFGTLIRRSLRYHWRSHLGVVLGAAIGSAALIGALVVGDSVRESLREQALRRLDRTTVALVGGDRVFDVKLLDRMIELNSARAESAPPTAGAHVTWGRGSSISILRLPANVSRQDGEARVNQVRLYGVPPMILELMRAGHATDSSTAPPGQVWVNGALAAKLSAHTGDELLIRLQKPSALSQEAAISTRNDSTITLRLRVAGIDSRSMGDLDLESGAQPALNAFVSREDLDAATGLGGKANLILGEAASLMQKMNRWDSFKHAYKMWRWKLGPNPFSDFGWYKMDGETGHGVDGKTTIEFIKPLFEASFKLSDAQLKWATQKSIGTSSALPTLELRTARIFLDAPVVRAALAADTKAQPVLTYLVNLLRAGTNTTPYSMVTAAGAPWTPVDLRDDEIIVNQWLAEDLQVKAGDEIALTYFDPESGARLAERTNTFRVRGIVPLEMPWADRTLMPDFPGLDKAESTSDWDAGFPLVHKIRQKDEDYWKKHKGTPKAFVTLAAGQKMWANRFGSVTAIRFPIPTNLLQVTEGRAGNPLPAAATNAIGGAHGVPRPTDIEGYRAALEAKILAGLKPEELGLRFEPVRDQALKAVDESQPFGQLFLGFSFFLILAALLLMAMLFQFGLEQRLPEIGTLLALGFTPKQVRKLLLREGVALALLGGILGTLGGIAYARAMLHGLTTVWREAVGATALSFHMTAQTLVIGLFASVIVSTGTIWLALRKLIRRPARELLSGEIESSTATKRSRGNLIGIITLLSAVGLVGWALAAGESSNAEIFFSAGSLVLIAGLSFASAWLTRLGGGAPVSDPARSNNTAHPAGPEVGAPISLSSLAIRGCARRRKRSLATMAMLACGSFLIASIGVFRLDANRDALKRTSGTGGFALIGETTMPVVHDLNTQAGRDFFALNDRDLAGVNFVPFRVRAGDEASCLNLNGAQQPKLLGVKPGMLQGRFSFAKSPDSAHESEPWITLRLGEFYPSNGKPLAADEVAAIGDANSIQWAMHKKVGDTIDYVDERGQPFKVRIVGAVANSILQGSLIIDEAEFIKRFPGESGYRMFLVDAPSNSVSQLSATLSRALQDVGLELTPAAQRLAQFNAVQNTYLGTFQVLGGLGLLLGSVGLGIVVLRNVLERRGELAVLMAVGFRKRSLQRLLLLENSMLLVLGLAVGVAAAAVAVLPAVLVPAGQLPYVSLALTLAAVMGNGAFWTWAATRFALRGNLLAALRNE